jgi:hypothetical protein
MLEEEAASGRGRVHSTGLAALASFGLAACSLTFSPGDLTQGERPAGGGGGGGGGEPVAGMMGGQARRCWRALRARPARGRPGR